MLSIMHQFSHRTLGYLVFILYCLTTPVLVSASQVLVTIDDNDVTLDDLETALASSPFYTQFNTLDENEQAAMRGDMLKRLVTAKLLEAEAHQLQLEKTPAFVKDLKAYINGVRYQKYLSNLRESINLSADEQKQLRQQYTGSADAYAAARSSIIANRYQALFQLTLQKLRDQYHVQLFLNRVTPQIQAETVLMQGDDLKIIYTDLMDQPHQAFDKNLILEKLFQQTEYMLISKAAIAENMDLSQDAQRYTDQRLPALLIDNKIKDWIPDDSVLQDYFNNHPELHRLKDRWHIGQLVVSTKQQAEALRKKIIDGEISLFQLAEKFSIDPGARFNRGDLGWVLEGTGLPEIEAAISKLDNNEISPVIETSRGYHVVTILKRRSGGEQQYYQIKDKLKQMIINEKMKQYLADLQQDHKVKWLIMENDQVKARQLLESKTQSNNQ